MINVYRLPENPLITPKDVKPSREGYEVLCAFNAGAIEHDGEILLLMRVAERPANPDMAECVLVPVLDTDLDPPDLKTLRFSRTDPDVNLDDPRGVVLPDRWLLTSISHIRIARSRDGRNFLIDESPALFPETSYETYGIEDPRVTKIGEIYYIVYKGVEPNGITQCLASTHDFITFTRHGIIFCPENMDAMLFPEKIGGRYVALHRPCPKYMGAPNMWVAYSDDLIHWGEHKFLLGCERGTWEGGRIGGGAVPIRTDRGWLVIYHAATPEEHYCLGAMLLDLEHPEKLIARSVEPILAPEAPYEVNGFKGNVVFTCGAVQKGDKLTVYYGAADECVAAAEFSIAEILESLR